MAGRNKLCKALASYCKAMRHEGHDMHDAIITWVATGQLMLGACHVRWGIG